MLPCVTCERWDHLQLESSGSEPGKESVSPEDHHSAGQGSAGTGTPRRALLVGAIPALGYAIVYMHEWGYLARFSVPAVFMTIDVMTVIRVSIALSGATWLLFAAGNLASMLWPHGKRIARRGTQIARTLGTLALGVLLMLIWPERRSYGWFFFGAGCFFGFLDFVWPVVVGPRHLSYSEKLKKADQVDDNTKSLFDRLASAAGPQVALLLAMAMGLLSFAYMRGLYAADKRCEFLLFRTPSARTAVVLKEYHDRMICTHIDWDTAQVESGFFFLSVPTDQPITFTTAIIGPLHVREDQPLMESSVSDDPNSPHSNITVLPVQTASGVLGESETSDDQ